MDRRFFLPVVLFICCAFSFSFSQSSAREEGEIIIISERVGKEINLEERNKYELFPDVKGFKSAVYTKLSNNIYFLEITFQDENTGELRIKRLQQSEISIKNRGLYIDRFEKNQTIKKEIKQKQEVEKYVYSNSGTSIYFELAGKGLFAINVDYRINKFNALSVGISPAEGGVLPSIMYYKFSGMKHRFETGIGITGILGQPEGLIGIFVNGAIGYRYQKKNGLIFRIGYTPLIGISGSRVAFIPLFFGVSLGYSF